MWPQTVEAVLDSIGSTLHQKFNNQRPPTGFFANAYVTMMHCTECGHKVKLRKDDLPTMIPEHCPHANTNNLRSSRKYIVMYCKDCDTIVERRPREEVIAVRAVAKELE